MPGWLAGLLVAVALYALFVAVLVVLGRREQATAVARFIPDCVVLARRLARDGRVPRRQRVYLGLLVAYLVVPFDLVPDFIPVAGVLDDAVLVVLVLRSVVRAAGAETIRERWPGPEQTLAVLLRAARRRGSFY
ncbi:MAG: hypothetical protein JWO74_691 [Solirubrobacterales bacterium]|nr:hypothetical protein [Solirubrobacterales bacterium]